MKKPITTSMDGDDCACECPSRYFVFIIDGNSDAIKKMNGRCETSGDLAANTENLPV